MKRYTSIGEHVIVRVENTKVPGTDLFSGRAVCNYGSPTCLVVEGDEVFFTKSLGNIPGEPNLCAVAYGDMVACIRTEPAPFTLPSAPAPEKVGDGGTWGGLEQ